MLDFCLICLVIYVYYYSLFMFIFILYSCLWIHFIFNLYSCLFYTCGVRQTGTIFTILSQGVNSALSFSVLLNKIDKPVSSFHLQL